MTQLYHYDDKGLFISQTEARMNPLEPDVPLVPANATLLEPPAIFAYEIAKFENDHWETISDYRGWRYYTSVDGEQLISDVNVTPPDGSLELNTDDGVIQNEDGTWRLKTADDHLNDLKQSKINELRLVTNAAINSGFESAALGANHYYDSEQYNIDWIQSVVVADEDTLITCDDLQGDVDSKQPRRHTPEQSLRVLKNGMVLLLAHKTRFRDLRGTVNAASDESEVENINW